MRIDAEVDASSGSVDDLPTESDNRSGSSSDADTDNEAQQGKVCTFLILCL